MADNEELDEARDELVKMAEDLARQGKLTRADLEKLAKTSSKTDKALQNLGEASKDTIAGFHNFAMAVGGGATEINTMKTVVSATGNAMSELIGTLPIFGDALGAAAKAATDLANLAIERLHVSFNAFQELSQAGLIGAEGISGLRDAMIESQIPMEYFSKILKDAAGDLMFFSGTALEGGKTLGNVMTRMQQGQDMQLRRLGFSVEEIGETVVDFQKMNQLMGTRQMKTTEDITQATVAYGKELDMVAKLTGMQRKEIQKNREAMLNNTRFSAWANQQQGRVNEEYIRSIMDFVGSIKKLAPQFGEGIQDLFASGGVATTEAGRRLIQQGMGPTVMKIRDMMMTGQLDQAKAQRMLFQEAIENKDKFRDLQAIIGDFGAGIPFEEMLRLAKAAQASDETIEEMKEAQKKQASGTDQLTDDLIKTTKALQKAQTNIDAVATAGDFAATAVKYMAETMNDFSFYVKTTILDMTEADARKEQAIQSKVMEARSMGIAASKEGKGEEATLGVSKEEFNRLVKQREESAARIKELDAKGDDLKAKEKQELETLKKAHDRAVEQIQWIKNESDQFGIKTMKLGGRMSRRELDVNRRNLIESENWVGSSWSNPFGSDAKAISGIYKGAGIEGPLGKTQTEAIGDVLRKFKESAGGDLGDVSDENRKKMIEQIASIARSKEGAESLGAFKEERDKYMKWYKEASADGLSKQEQEAQQKQLQALNRLEQILESHGVLFDEFVRKAEDTKNQLEHIKQQGSM